MWTSENIQVLVVLSASRVKENLNYSSTLGMRECQSNTIFLYFHIENVRLLNVCILTKGDCFNWFSLFPWKHSSKTVLRNRVLRTLTDGTLKEQEQNSAELIENRYGRDTVQQLKNGNRSNACRTATEHVLSSDPCVSSDQYIHTTNSCKATMQATF